MAAGSSGQQDRVLGSGERGCNKGSWAATAEGRPASLSRGSGYFVWHDALGWHIRARGAPGELFQAQVFADAALRVSATSEALRKTLQLQARSFRFGVAGSRRAEGVGFRSACASRLSFRLGPSRRPSSRPPRASQQPLYLGAKGFAPGASFVLQRPSETGIGGRILIGPTCPVLGPGVDCPPAKPGAGTIRIETAPSDRGGGGGGQLVKTITSDAAGNFATELSPGEYLLVVVKNNDGLSYPRPKPSRAIVEAGVVTQVTLLLDTGIR